MCEQVKSVNVECGILGSEKEICPHDPKRNPRARAVRTACRHVRLMYLLQRKGVSAVKVSYSKGGYRVYKVCRS